MLACFRLPPISTILYSGLALLTPLSSFLSNRTFRRSVQNQAPASSDLSNRASKVRVNLSVNRCISPAASGDDRSEAEAPLLPNSTSEPKAASTESIGFVLGATDTTLSWLRVRIAQNPSLSSVPATYCFLQPPSERYAPATHGDAKTVSEAQEYALTLQSYISGASRSEDKQNDPVFESETKLLLTAASAGNQSSYGDFETLVKVLCEPETGLILVDTLDAMMKQARRARANQRQHKRGKDLMKRLSEFLKHRRMSVEQWFAIMDASGAATANGTVTSRELRIGMKQLSSREEGSGGTSGKASGLPSLVLSGIQLTEDEITTLLRFMDPSGEGDLSIDEVKEAFDRAQATRPNERLFSYAEKVLRGLDLRMKKRGIKAPQWYEWMDLTGSGVLMVDELREGYAVLIDPSAHSLPKRVPRDSEKRAARLRKFQNQQFTAEVRLVDTSGTAVEDASASESTSTPTPASRIVAGDPRAGDMETTVVGPGRSSIDPPGLVGTSSSGTEWKYAFLEASDEEIENLVDAFLHFDSSRNELGSFLTFVNSVAKNPGSVHRDIQRVATFMTHLVQRLEDEWTKHGELSTDGFEDNTIDVASIASTISRNAMLSVVEFLDRKNRGTVNIVDLRELFELAVLPATMDAWSFDVAPVPSRLAERGLEILAKESELDDVLEKGQIEVATASPKGLKGELDFAVREMFRGVDINPDGCIRVKVLEDHFRRARKLRETDKIRAHGRVVARRINTLLLYVNTSCAAWVRRAGPGQTISGRADLDVSLATLVRWAVDQRKVDNETARAEHKQILKEAQLVASKVSINAFGQVEMGPVVDQEVLKSKPKLVDEKVPPFSKTDIAALMCFTDPTLGTPIVTPDKLNTALLLASRNMQAAERSRLISTELRLAEFLWKIEALMNKNNTRFVDLFGSTATGVISSIGIVDSLMRIIEPSEKRADEFSKRARAAAMDAELERKQYEREASYKRKRHLEREARRREAETLGVAAVIRAIHQQMGANEVDVPGLLRMLDRNGNRHVTSEELVQGLAKVSGPNAGLRAEQLRQEKARAKQRRAMSKRQKELQMMQKKMIETERAGAAVAMKLLIDLVRRSGRSVGDFFESEDLMLDGKTRHIASTAICEGLWQMGYAARSSDVETMVKYFDDAGIMAVEEKKLEEALDTFKYQQAACGVAHNLYEKYSDLGDIFFSRNVFADGNLSRKDLVEGMQRLRGDPDSELWRVRLTWTERNAEDHRRALIKFYDCTREQNMNILKLFGVTDKHQRIPKENFTAWLRSLKAMRAKLPSEEKVVPSPRNEDSEVLDAAQNSPELTDHDLARIMAFLDPGYRDEVVPAMFLDALLLSNTVLKPLQEKPSVVSAGRMMRQVFLNSNSEAKLEHVSLYEIFEQNKMVFKEAGIGDLGDPGILLLFIGTNTTRAFDSNGFATSFAFGTSIFSVDGLDDLRRAILSVNPSGYNLVVLFDSIGYLVDKAQPQLVSLKSVVDRMPAGLAGAAVSTSRGLLEVLGQLVASSPVVWNGAKDQSTREYIWPQLQCDLGAAVALGHPLACATVPGLDVERVPVVVWDGTWFRIFAAGQVVASRSLDARVEVLGPNGTMDEVMLRGAIANIGETVRNVAVVPANTAVMLVQINAARSLVLPKVERSLRPPPPCATPQSNAKKSSMGGSEGGAEHVREECALSSEDIVTFVQHIALSENDHLIGPEEFVQTFRRYKRDKVLAQSVQDARSVLHQIRCMIEAKNLGFRQWVRMLGEGTIIGDTRRYTLLHLTAGLRHLSEKGSANRFSKNDAIAVIRYIETEQGGGHFTKESLVQALDSSAANDQDETKKRYLFEQFDLYLKTKNLDVRRMAHDVLGLTHERRLSPEQLILSLEGIMSAGGNPLVAEDKKKKVPYTAPLTPGEAEQQLRIRHELFARLEQTGALGPFRCMMALLHKRGKRPHALMESLDEKMLGRGKTVTTVTRAELIDVIKHSTQPLNEARRFLRKGANDAGTNPIKESNEFIGRMTELTQSGVTKIASSLDDYIRRAPGGFDGVFSFIVPKYPDKKLTKDAKVAAGKAWRLSPDEFRLALKKLKLKLPKSDTNKLIAHLVGLSSGSDRKEKYIQLGDLQTLLKETRKWTWQTEQSLKPLLSKRELHLVSNYISPEKDVSVREIRLVLQQCKYWRRKLASSLGISRATAKSQDPAPLPETAPRVLLQVVFVVGGPFSGKSSVCRLLAMALGYTYLAQRRDIAEDTESAVRHQYVPPELVVNLLRQAMTEKAEAYGSRGFVVEGFPSDHKSAVAWAALNSDFAEVRGVVALDCSVDLMEARSTGKSIQERIRSWVIHTERELHDIGKTFTVHIVNADSPVDEVAAAVSSLFMPLSGADEDEGQAESQHRGPENISVSVHAGEGKKQQAVRGGEGGVYTVGLRAGGAHTIFFE